jgi:hypothetical protein
VHVLYAAISLLVAKAVSVALLNVETKEIKRNISRRTTGTRIFVLVVVRILKQKGSLQSTVQLNAILEQRDIIHRKQSEKKEEDTEHGR